MSEEPTFSDKYGYGYSGIYDWIAKELGASEHASWEIGDWQGDAIAVFKFPDGRVGILNHCYGSCSGCDSYQACGSDGEIESLARSYKDSVFMFSSADDVLKHCSEKWTEGDAGYHIDAAGYTKLYKEQIPSFINGHKA